MKLNKYNNLNYRNNWLDSLDIEYSELISKFIFLSWDITYEFLLMNKNTNNLLQIWVFVPAYTRSYVVKTDLKR